MLSNRNRWNRQQCGDCDYASKASAKEKLGHWFVLYLQLIGGDGHAIGFDDPVDEPNHGKRTELPPRIIDEGQKPADRCFLSCCICPRVFLGPLRPGTLDAARPQPANADARALV
jgi:hypothetical protein